MNNIKGSIFLLGMFFLSCSNSSNGINRERNIGAHELNDSSVYQNKVYKMVIYFKNGRVDRYKLYRANSNISLSGKAELLTIDGEVPEGTNRIDYNNPKNGVGYKCDTTYQFISDELSISFAIEKDKKK